MEKWRFTSLKTGKMEISLPENWKNGDLTPWKLEFTLQKPSKNATLGLKQQKWWSFTTKTSAFWTSKMVEFYHRKIDVSTVYHQKGGVWFFTNRRGLNQRYICQPIWSIFRNWRKHCTSWGYRLVYHPWPWKLEEISTWSCKKNIRKHHVQQHTSASNNNNRQVYHQIKLV